MTSETTAKKNIQKLQRAIVDGLEDVKGQDIVVFNTEHLSPLFERVVVASGTSNRQTKALAASVRDAVKDAGFPKPRTEGEDNGEWIIVDCGQAVVHVMQPAIRQYYHLEEIWGDKPVRVKHGTDKPTPAARAATEREKPAAKKAAAKVPAKAPAKTPTKAGAKPTAKTPAKAAAKAPAKRAAPSGTRSAAGKAPARKATPMKVVKVGAPVAKKAAVKRAAAKATGSAPRKTTRAPKARA